MLLRAKKPGKATLTFGVSGEIYETWGGGTGAWNWDHDSTTLDFTIAGAPAPVAAPTARATVSLVPHVELSASATALQVGNEVTITGLADGFGLADYYIYLSSGGEIRTDRENHTEIRKPDPLFEVVSATRGSDRIELVLRAQKAGESSLKILVSGRITGVIDGKETYRWAASRAALDFTIAPAAAPAVPRVDLDAGATTLYVGDVVTIKGLAKGFDQEIYTFSLSSGGEASTSYVSDTKIIKTDPLFEFVSVTGMPGSAWLVLRAKKPGTATLTFLTQGETYETMDGGTGVWGWGRASTTLELTISEPSTPAN